MKQRKIIKMIGLSIITAVLLVGCGNGSSTSTISPAPTASPTPTSSSKKLSGSIIKGPIDGAEIIVFDSTDTEIVRTLSKLGKYELPSFDVTSDFYTIESKGGTYTDESTNTIVNIPATTGLKTLLSKMELNDMLAKKDFAAITPETTILTALIKSRVDAGKDLATATTESEKIVYDLMIKHTSPINGMSGDTILKRGDFTKTTPANRAEAFARNRAVSFSNLAKNLGISPDSIFDIIEKLAVDYDDGKADTIEIEGKDVNATETYGLSRTELFNDTTSRLRDGNLSEAQTEELRTLGIDIDEIKGDQVIKDAALKEKVDMYMASNTLPTLHILPVMSDEDGDDTDAKATYTLTAKQNVNVTIETPEGSWITPMWRYNDNPLPMVIRTNRGNAMTLNLDNQLDADSTIHWHGFKIPAIMDGGPDVPVASKDKKAYTFTMNQPAASLWFHPHPDMQTGKQVYMGLAGVYLLEDDITKQLETNKNLPSGDKDIVLLVQDRRFAAEVNGVRELQYKTMDMDSDGMLGDKVLVNGSVIPKQEVDTAQYRLRLYNVSNARNYKFSFNDNRKFKVVGTDGGLLNEPVELDHITLGAAERVEIVVDFSNDTVGSKVMLVSQATQGGMMNMGNNNSGSGMSGTEESTVGSGDGLVIMRFDVTTAVIDDVTLYSALPSTAEIANRIDPTTAVNQDASRKFVMTMARGNMGGTEGNSNMSFVINGKSFDANRVDEFVAAGTTEIWEITNRSPMAHPFHAHAVQYQILERDGKPATGTDLGWKDTFLVQPRKSVKIIAKFDPEINVGDYMYHCHILEHEDAGMMGYFRVGDIGNVGN